MSSENPQPDPSPEGVPAERSAPETQREPDLLKGRRYTRVCAGGVLFLDLLLLGLDALAVGEFLLESLIGVTAMLVICLFLWLGQDWARWIVGIRCGIGAVVGFAGAINMFMLGAPYSFWMHLISGSLFCAATYVLLAHPDVEAFCKSKPPRYPWWGGGGGGGSGARR
jgi:hypothetical protein